MIHEHFCCNRGFAAATSLRRAGSPLASSTYCTSTHRGLTAPRARLATRLRDFATNRHESCGLGVISKPRIYVQFVSGAPHQPSVGPWGYFEAYRNLAPRIETASGSFSYQACSCRRLIRRSLSPLPPPDTHFQRVALFYNAVRTGASSDFLGKGAESDVAIIQTRP